MVLITSLIIAFTLIKREIYMYDVHNARWTSLYSFPKRDAGDANSLLLQPLLSASFRTLQLVRTSLGGVQRRPPSTSAFRLAVLSTNAEFWDTLDKREATVWRHFRLIPVVGRRFGTEWASRKKLNGESFLLRFIIIIIIIWMFLFFLMSSLDLICGYAKIYVELNAHQK